MYTHAFAYVYHPVPTLLQNCTGRGDDITVAEWTLILLREQQQGGAGWGGAGKDTIHGRTMRNSHRLSRSVQRASSAEGVRTMIIRITRIGETGAHHHHPFTHSPTTHHPPPTTHHFPPLPTPTTTTEGKKALFAFSSRNLSRNLFSWPNN